MSSCIVSKNALPALESVVVRKKYTTVGRFQTPEKSKSSQNNDESLSSSSSLSRSSMSRSKEDSFNVKLFEQHKLVVVSNGNEGKRVNNNVEMTNQKQFRLEDEKLDKRSLLEMESSKGLDSKLGLNLKSPNLNGPSRLDAVAAANTPMRIRNDGKNELMRTLFGNQNTMNGKDIKILSSDLNEEEDYEEEDDEDFDEDETEEMPEWMEGEEGSGLINFSESTQMIEREHLKYKATWSKKAILIGNHDGDDDICTYENERVVEIQKMKEEDIREGM